MPLAKTLLWLVVAWFVGGCGGGDDDRATLERVAQVRGYSVLDAALKRAGLDATLAERNAQLTLFAPSNAAFDTFARQLGFADAGTMINILPVSVLRDLLAYHVLPAERRSRALLSGSPGALPTLLNLDGVPAAIDVSAQAGVRLTDAAFNSAAVTLADIDAGNGVLHAIDRVLVPPGVLNLVQMAQVSPLLSGLAQALSTTNLQTVLAGAGPYTVFAPTTAAFAGAAALGLNNPQLTTALAYHVVGANLPAAQLPFNTAVGTLAGQSFVINPGTPPTITDTTVIPARIVATDIRASNGILHVIDKVLLPQL